MVTALTSKLWDIVNSSTTYNFAKNPLPVFFMLYAKKHGVTFSFDEEKKCVDLNGVDQLDEVESFMVEKLSENSMLDIESDVEMFKTLWEEISSINMVSTFYTHAINYLTEQYAVLSNTPIISEKINSLIPNIVVAFYNHYSISDSEEQKKSENWIDNYTFLDCQDRDINHNIQGLLWLIRAIIKDTKNKNWKIDELKKFVICEFLRIDVNNDYGYSLLSMPEDYDFWMDVNYLKKTYLEEDKSALLISFKKEMSQNENFKKFCGGIIEEGLLDFVIELPSLANGDSNQLFVGLSSSANFGDVLFINGGKALKSNGTLDWNLLINNILISNNFSEWDSEKLDKYFRPDMIYKLDYDSLRDGDYEIIPSTFWLWDNKISEDKVFVELSDVFEVVQSIKAPYQRTHNLTTFNFSGTPLDLFRAYKYYPQSIYQGMVHYNEEAVVLTAEDFEIGICRWRGDDEFATESKNLVLRLKKDSPVTLDYAAYALLSNENIKEVGCNMCILNYEDNWHNFLKCQIAIHKDKAKQEEIVENLRNEYTQQRQKELEAEMQRLGIRTASSGMVHMLGPTFAKIESTLYDLKSEELTATAQGAVEALNDNINYIKRFIKMAGADIMQARMSMKERQVNEVISSIQKSWANLSSSRIFEVTYLSGVSDDVTFKIDESYFRVLFDTLFDNAYRHGFGKRKSVGNRVSISSQLVQKNRKEYVLLTVANNGEPFPEDFTLQKFISRGEYCGETGRTGLGGNHIYSILKRHDGFLNVTHNAEWNCIFEMLIPVAFQNDVESKNVCEYGNSSKCL